MYQSTSTNRYPPLIFLLPLLAATMEWMFLSCVDSKPTVEQEVHNRSLVLLKDTAEFHADNDIAMTVRSLADALRVGEPLDSAQYDFEGILTDGQGTPLYTDVQGAPGEWQVDVLDINNAIIRNIYLGDLLPGDLQSYILENLELRTVEEMDYNGIEALEDDETDVSVFDCDGVFLRFEVRAGTAPNGLEGPQLRIIMSSEPPSAAERRKDA